MEINPIIASSLRGAAGDAAIHPGYFANDSLLSPEEQTNKAKETAEDFEAMFVQLSLKQMRPKLEGGLFNDGLAQDVFYQFMDEAIAKEIARSPSNNFGIAASMMQQGF